MKRWIELLISSSSLTVIFLFDSDGPVSFTSLRLQVSPDSRRNKTEIAWPLKPTAPIDPTHRAYGR